MAKLKAASGIVGIRGTIAGATFADNSTGGWVRSWNRCSSRATPGRIAVRAAWSQRLEGWYALSGAQQSTWNAFAAAAPQAQVGPFGEVYYLSGLEWFCRVNLWLSQVGRAATNVPPVSAEPAAPTISGILVQVTPVQLAYISYPTGHYTGFDLVLYVGMRPTPGNNSQVARPPLVLGTQSPGLDVTLFDNELEDTYGEVSSGRYWIADVFKQTTDGYRSNRTRISTVGS